MFIHLTTSTYNTDIKLRYQEYYAERNLDYGLLINDNIILLVCFVFISHGYICFLGCLTATSFCVSLAISPAVMLFCRNKSTRLTAVVGGLIVSLGILFTSFATSFPHLFFSYGTVIGKACLSIIYTFSTSLQKRNIFWQESLHHATL